MGWSTRQCTLFLLVSRFTISHEVSDAHAVSHGELSIPEPSQSGAHLSELPICIAGQAVPRIYLLGHAKCGTTTVAKDLHRAGARFFTFGGVPVLGDAPVGKESHLFDSICGFRANEFYRDQISGCIPAAAEGARERWLRGIHNMSCGRPQATLLDATPSNARLPGLPAFMSKVYAGDAHRLGFILLLREPLARLQSQWYHVRQAQSRTGPLPVELRHSFTAFLNIMEPKVAWYKAQGYEGMDVDMSVDWVYRSLYNLTLRSWLGSFNGGQFVVVPMELYRSSAERREELLRLLRERFGATLSDHDLGGQLSHHNEGAHPALLEEVDGAAVGRWYGSFFGPDIRGLASSIASAPGLHLVGCAAGGGGGAPSAAGVSECLRRSLPCLV